MIDVKDILVDDTNDLIFRDGDFVVDYSDPQHQEHLISAFKGYYKETPLVGVGIFQYLKSAGKAAEIKREITIQLEEDKYLVNSVTVSNQDDITIHIDAKRIS